MAAARNEDPARILKRHWPNDDRAAVIMRAGVSQTTSEIYPAYDRTGPYQSIAPGAALPKLLGRPDVLKLDMRGVHTYRIPNDAGLPPVPIFIAEGAPAPNVQLPFAPTILGPVKKVLVLSAITGELEDGNAESTAAVVGRSIANRTNKTVDTIAFDANPGDDIRPPGLLFGITPLTAATAGVDAVFQDRRTLAAAIGAAGIDTSDLVFVCSPGEAQFMADKLGEEIGENSVLSTLGLPAKTVAAFAPAALSYGYLGIPEIETSKDATFHSEDTNPLDIGAAANPVKSVFQTNIISIRVRAMLAYAVAPGGAAVVQNVNW